MMDGAIMSNVCAIMDAQGFYMNGVFYPREIAVLSHTLKECVLCDINIKRSDMNKKDRVTNNYLSNNILGMSMGSSNLNNKHKQTDDGLQMINNLYDMVKTEKRTFVAIKNEQLAEILELWAIPYIKLEEFNCPSFQKLKERYRTTPCHFHDRTVPDRRKLRCAEQKCEVLWKWIIDYWKLNSK